MIETSLRVSQTVLEELTESELQRMVVGVLQYNGFLLKGTWPIYNIYFDVKTDEECFTNHEFSVRMCQSEEDEKQVEQLKALMGDAVPDGTRRFEMRRHPPSTTP